MPKLRILIVVPNYSTLGGPPTMADDLASAFADQGHEVQVVGLLWNAKPDRAVYRNIDRPGVDVLRVHPTELFGGSKVSALVSKWVFSSYLARRRVASALRGSSFDLLISSSPAVTTAGLINWALKRFKPRSFIHVVDFFPFHQYALGLLPAGVISTVARIFEGVMLSKFDVVGCMSPANIQFLEENYRLPGGQTHVILPIFGDVTAVAPTSREQIRSKYSLPDSRPIALFGGQLTEGRGISEILEAARLAEEKCSDLCFLIVGKGRLKSLVLREIEYGRRNLYLIDELPRSDYLELAAACDVGLVVTVAGVNVPTFPSKTIDYLRAYLPIIASVEDSTDYGNFIETQGLGLAIAAGDPRALFEALSDFEDCFDRTDFRENARNALLRYFSNISAVETILSETGCS